MEIALEKGKKYKVAFLRLIRWTEGDGSGREGYYLRDYFSDGVYLGPDKYGIEPVVNLLRKIPVTVKIATERLERVQSLAEKEHRTLTSVIEWAIDAYCERRERQLKILNERSGK